MYLGIDLGTSGVKALILDDQGVHVAIATQPLSVHRPKQGYSEQNPEDWVRALSQVFRDLREHLPQVRAVGLAGHMHGLVLLNEQQAVLRPCILWNDTRAHAQADALDTMPAFHEISGNRVFPGFSAPKMAWVKDEEPDIWAQAHHMLFPKDYLGFWLTGEIAGEPSDAAGSSLFDCVQGVWSHELCGLAGLSPSSLPPMIASDQSRGALRQEICEAFGFNPSVVVAGGAGDNAAAALGARRVKSGQSLLSLGTSGVLLTVNELWQPAPQTAVHSFSHSVGRRFIQMGVTLCATDSLVWLAELMGSTPQDLCTPLTDTPEVPGLLLFHPYLSGERTPHNFSSPFGNFLFLDRRHNQQDLTRAVLEGVAYSIADCCHCLETAGAEVGDLALVGGGGHIPYLVQTIANILDRPLHPCDQSDHVAAIGAAFLGMAAVHQVPVQDLVPQLISQRSAVPVEPVTGAAATYAKAHDLYGCAFAQLKDLSNDIL